MAKHWTRNLPEVGNAITGDRSEFAPRGTSRHAEELDAEIQATRARLAELRKQRKACERALNINAHRAWTPKDVAAAKAEAGA